MTEKTLDWLNHNRFIAYPFVNDEGLMSEGRRVPTCVLLDCLVMDTRHIGRVPELTFTGIDVGEDSTHVTFTYDGAGYGYDIDGHADDDPQRWMSGEGSIVRVDGSMIAGAPDEFFHIKLVFSSHEYIKDKVGVGSWVFTGKILPSKVVSVTASGVMGIKTSGSMFVPGYDRPGVATGVVHLVDGYRTQPVVQNGKVVVKVGLPYGEDPCHYVEDTGSSSLDDEIICDNLMFFFCGQNANTTGNVNINGGPGVIVTQGRTYTAKKDIIDTYGKVGIEKGEQIPCIEVVAASELLRIYRPEPIEGGGSPEGQ